MAYGVIGNTADFGSVIQGSSPCGTTHIFLMGFGIEERDVTAYWAERSSKQGFLTCGFAGNKTNEAQEKEYADKIDFVSPHIVEGLSTIDYGCGVGRWSHLFNDDIYVGLDIEDSLLSIARKSHPTKKFLRLKTPSLSELDENYLHAIKNSSQFLSVCVLQHCNDSLVLRIFKNLHDIKPNQMRFILYENIEVQANHVAGRNGQEYLELMTQAGYVGELEHYSHVVHNEIHGVSIIKT